MIPYGLPSFIPRLPVTPRLLCDCSCCLSRPRHGGHLKRKRHIMTTKTLSKSELAQFTGSDNWYRHTINRNVLYADRKSTRLNSSHLVISYAVFCLKKKNTKNFTVTIQADDYFQYCRVTGAMSLIGSLALVGAAVAVVLAIFFF